jgi:hypothetical protein
VLVVVEDFIQVVAALVACVAQLQQLAAAVV